MRKVHYISGVIVTMFIGFHLFNHTWSIFGAEKHIEMMNKLRPYYRNIIVETILLMAVMLQIFSGLKLFRSSKKTAVSNFDKLHIWSGLYLAIFFIIHISAVLIGRIFLHLDTNFYFGVAGLNAFPLNLFFIPYYVLAIISFFAHVSSIHSKKMKLNIFSLTPNWQSVIVLIFGICLAIVILYGLTNHFKGVEIPYEYKILQGKI